MSKINKLFIIIIGSLSLVFGTGILEAQSSLSEVIAEAKEAKQKGEEYEFNNLHNFGIEAIYEHKEELGDLLASHEIIMTLLNVYLRTENEVTKTHDLDESKVKKQLELFEFYFSKGIGLAMKPTGLDINDYGFGYNDYLKLDPFIL